MSNKYTTSTGEKLSQGAINTRLRNTYRSMEIGKVELIWNEENISFSCRNCHMEWESYKSGKFTLHSNIMQRLGYIAKHDREGFIKRLMFVSEEDKQEQLNTLI